MNRYLAKNERGQPLAILEADTATNAELFGLRNLAGFRHAEPLPSAPGEPPPKTAMAEAFENLYRREGFSQAEAERMAKIASPPPAKDEGPSRGQLEAAFQRFYVTHGFSEAEAERMAKTAADVNDPLARLKTIKVPYQAPDPRFLPQGRGAKTFSERDKGSKEIELRESGELVHG